jgi:CDP-2,3-bis-(O-geranylgeranyl)-sn-glycerol synthase
MQLLSILQALCLLAIANGTPVVIKKLLGSWAALPLDAGTKWPDRRPLFGSSKTVRGILASIAITAALAPLLGLRAGVGALVATFAMLGDLFSSFTKRRLGFPSSTQAIGLDQIPESLLPLLVCHKQLALSFVDVALCVSVFLAGELIASRLLYWLRVRDQPY